MKRVKNTHNQYLKKTRTAIDKKSIWRYSVLSILMTGFLFACLAHSGGLPLSKQDQVKLDSILTKCEAHRKSMDPLPAELNEKFVSMIEALKAALFVKTPISDVSDVSDRDSGEQNQSAVSQQETMDEIALSSSLADLSLAKDTQEIDCNKEVEILEAGGVNSTIPAIPQKQKNEYDRSYIQDDAQLRQPFKEVLNYLIKQTQEKYQLEIDPDSQNSILKSLILGDISSVDALKKEDYQIVPPGVLFHTWMPLYGTAIFDGSNNVKGIDYTQRLLDEANQFNEWGIPIIIVYSKEGMDPDEVIKMNQWINIHSNILLINIEEDLLTWRSFDQYQKFSIPLKGFPAHFKAMMNAKNEPEDAKQKIEVLSARYIDGLRVHVLLDFSNFLDLAQKKAKALNKTKWMSHFENVGAHSIIYSDMDNTFLTRPRFTLAPLGITRCMTFQANIFEAVKKVLDSTMWASNETLSLQAIAEQTQEMIVLEGSHDFHSVLKRCELPDLRQQSKKLCGYLMDGQIMRNYKALIGINSDFVRVFTPESGYLMSNKKGSTWYLFMLMLEKLLLDIQDIKAIQDIQTAFQECFLLVFMVPESSEYIQAVQQLGQLHIGRDKSWYQNRYRRINEDSSDKIPKNKT